MSSQNTGGREEACNGIPAGPERETRRKPRDAPGKRREREGQETKCSLANHTEAAAADKMHNQARRRGSARKAQVAENDEREGPKTAEAQRSRGRQQ